MKIITTCCFFMALFACVTLTAQNAAPGTFVKQKVQIISSTGQSIDKTSFFFTAANNKALKKQVGNAQLALIKKGCERKTYPACIQKILNYDPMKEGAYDKMEAVFISLKAYRIATFNQMYKNDNLGEHSILIVPASENKNVGGNCNFTKDFYIIVSSNDIKIL